jgi:uncharacterized protein
MGGYSDFCMRPPDQADPVAGICHARGSNAHLPPVWLIYITVDDLDESVRRCESLGGKVVAPPHNMAASGRYCVIADPACAVSALFEPAK